MDFAWIRRYGSYSRYVLPVLLSLLIAAYRRYDTRTHGWKINAQGERVL